MPSRDGAPRTPGFGKPPDSAPAELLIEKLTPHFNFAHLSR
ncbi:hypothetical protein M790_05670 [Neisseria gonorrhoeae MU_NG25]|nr:hypothetical protein M790_05670 [Neisseria gonorrhoeae MU_NG25]